MSERTLAGTGATPCVGTGTVVWYRPNTALPDEDETVAPADRSAEHDRFETAREQARDELEAEHDRTAERVGEEEAAVFDAHIQFLDDPQIDDDVFPTAELCESFEALFRVTDDERPRGIRAEPLCEGCFHGVRLPRAGLPQRQEVRRTALERISEDRRPVLLVPSEAKSAWLLHDTATPREHRPDRTAEHPRPLRFVTLFVIEIRPRR